MKISIIIPNYNHAKFLKKRIDSILNQKFTDFEVIILDDCSTDESKDIINSYKDERISLKLFNDKNSGSPFKQWKKGIEAAKYDYIWIAESDDWADLNFLYEAENILKTQQNISLYYSNSQLVAEDETFFENSIKKYTEDLDEKLWNNNHLYNGKDYVKKYLFYKNFILNASSVIFKKSNAIKSIDEIINFKTSGDWLFWALILTEGEVYFNDNKLNFFRHSLQSTRNYNTLEKKQLRIVEKINVQEKIISLYNFSSSFIKKTRKNLTKEWIKNHSFKELFSRRYYNILKLNFYKDVSIINFIFFTFIYKLKFQWLKKLK